MMLQLEERSNDKEAFYVTFVVWFLYHSVQSHCDRSVIFFHGLEHIESFSRNDGGHIFVSKEGGYYFLNKD